MKNSDEKNKFVQILETEKRLKSHQKKKKTHLECAHTPARTHIYHSASMYTSYKCFIHKTSTRHTISQSSN